MALLCSTNCGTVALPAPLDDCDLTIFRDSGDRFVLIPCDYQFTDITDPVEWQALKTAGNVICTPRGFWTKGIPAQTTFDVSCGLKFSVQDGQQIDFESSLLDPSTLSDQAFWKSIRENYRHYRVIPLTCQGQFLVTEEYATAVTATDVSPGHEFSWVAPPDYEIPQGENQLIKLVGSMFIPTGGILCTRYLPGIKAIVCD